MRSGNLLSLDEDLADRWAALTEDDLVSHEKATLISNRHGLVLQNARFRPAAFRVNMQVGLAGIAGVADSPETSPTDHRLANGDRDASLLQVTQQHFDAGTCNHHMIARQRVSVPFRRDVMVAAFRGYRRITNSAHRSDETAAPLRGFLELGVTKWQWTHRTRNAVAISPDTWIVDQYFLDRDGNQEIQLELFFDYGSNPALYPEWQAYFRRYQPPTLIVWGQNDHIFPAEGAHPYKRDLTELEFHLLNTGHFALEEDGAFIAERIREFVGTRTARKSASSIR